MSVFNVLFIGSILEDEAQPLQRCFFKFLPLPEVSAVYHSWRPIQTPLTAQSSFLLGQWLIYHYLSTSVLVVYESYWMYPYHNSHKKFHIGFNNNTNSERKKIVILYSVYIIIFLFAIYWKALSIYFRICPYHFYWVLAE